MSEKLVYSIEQNVRPNVMEKFGKVEKHHDEPSSKRKVPKRYFCYVIIVTVLVSMFIGALTSAGISYVFYIRGDGHYRDNITKGVDVGVKPSLAMYTYYLCHGCRREPCENVCLWQENSWYGLGKWSTCSVSCGTGMRTRDSKCNGTHCEGGHQDVELCVKPTCVDSWFGWSDWSICSVSCGSGMRVRHRKCNGTNCEGDHRDVEVCTNPICLGIWLNWGPWSQCSTTCGLGARFRVRACNNGFCGYDHRQDESCNEVCYSHSWNNKPNLITIIVSVAMCMLVTARAHSLR